MSVLGHPGESFRVVRWYEYAATGSGEDFSNPAPIAAASTDVFAIPAGTLITNVYVYIHTALTGTTNLDVGDDDSANGFVDGSLSIADLGVTGLYSWDAKLSGSYLRVQTAGATDAADIYVVPQAKYYAAAGKEVKYVTSTANTAGKFAIIVEGFYLGR